MLIKFIKWRIHKQKVRERLRKFVRNQSLLKFYYFKHIEDPMLYLKLMDEEWRLLDA